MIAWRAVTEATAAARTNQKLSLPRFLMVHWVSSFYTIPKRDSGENEAKPRWKDGVKGERDENKGTKVE